MKLRVSKVTAKPKVSVIIPSLPHRKKSLERAIASVKAQTYKNIEIIVEYGGSNAQEARNLAALQAKGKYIAFLDDDDEFYPDKIEKQVKFMEEHSNVKLCITWLDDYRFGNYRQSKPKEWWEFEQLIQGFNISCTTSFMIEKQTFFDIGAMDESLNDGHEYDLALRVCLHRQNAVYCIQETLCKMNAPEGGNMSDDFGNKLRGQLQFIKKWGKYYDARRWVKTVGCNLLFLIGFVSPWTVHKIFAITKDKTDEMGSSK